jgi:UDP-2-acetamido-2,6-beta-L-arabino-hexul-4-ose reductase
VTTVLVTGSGGFIGRNLVARVSRRPEYHVVPLEIAATEGDWRGALARADVVVHLAGVNRPERVEDFQAGNAALTEWMCGLLRELDRKPKVVMASSIQAASDSPYGTSKRRAEEALLAYRGATGAPVSIYRLRNVFGKWCRPNYNSVTATFCHNLAHDLPITISDPANVVDLVYIDDVVEVFLAELSNAAAGPASGYAADTIPVTRITLAELAGRIQAYHEMHSSLRVPDFAVRFNRQLYATYLSCVEPGRQEYGLDIKADQRGSLAEFLKSPHCGQVFVSRTHPGITRGNHYHHTKTEKFFVVEGEGLIRMRRVEGDEVIEYRVAGSSFRVVDIPPGYTHSISNVGRTDMVTVFWASEPLDPDHPDTYALPV